MRALALVLTVSSFAIALPAFANEGGAVFSDVDGKIVLKQETGVIKAELGTLAATGTEVIVGLDATAQLYMNGCAIEMASGSHFVVPALAPCGKGETFRVDGMQITPVNGEGSGIGGLGANQGIVMVAGGLAMVGAVAFVALAEDDAASNN
jgi:hypothetical protein